MCVSRDQALQKGDYDRALELAQGILELKDKDMPPRRADELRLAARNIIANVHMARERYEEAKIIFEVRLKDLLV